MFWRLFIMHYSGRRRTRGRRVGMRRRPWNARRRLLEVPLLSLLLTNLRKMRMETHLLMPRR